MPATWESSVLAAISTDPRQLAEDVAADLGLLSASVIEVARLHLEALDCALAMDAPELLADQLRWQHARLLSAGATFGPDDVSAAVRATLARLLDEAGL